MPMGEEPCVLGCSASVTRIGTNVHMHEQCEFRLIHCSKCNECTTAALVDTHRANEYGCINIVRCPLGCTRKDESAVGGKRTHDAMTGCLVTGVHIGEVEEHMQRCPARKILCVACNTLVSVAAFDAHIQAADEAHVRAIASQLLGDRLAPDAFGLELNTVEAKPDSDSSASTPPVDSRLTQKIALHVTCGKSALTITVRLTTPMHKISRLACNILNKKQNSAKLTYKTMSIDLSKNSWDCGFTGQEVLTLIVEQEGDVVVA